MRTTTKGECVVCGHDAHGDKPCTHCHCARSPLKHPQGKKAPSLRPKRKPRRKKHLIKKRSRR